MRTNQKKAFSKPRCVECGVELSGERSSYNNKSDRLYCESCQTISDIKKTWKPISSGSVSRMMVINNK